LLYYSVFAADTLLYAVTLTFDLERLQCIACDVMKFSTKFERNRAIRGTIIAILICDLMILNMFALGYMVLFNKFERRQLIRA